MLKEFLPPCTLQSDNVYKSIDWETETEKFWNFGTDYQNYLKCGNIENLNKLPIYASILSEYFLLDLVIEKKSGNKPKQSLSLNDLNIVSNSVQETNEKLLATNSRRLLKSADTYLATNIAPLINTVKSINN